MRAKVSQLTGERVSLLTSTGSHIRFDSTTLPFTLLYPLQFVS